MTPHNRGFLDKKIVCDKPRIGPPPPSVRGCKSGLKSALKSSSVRPALSPIHTTSDTKRHDPIHFNGELPISGDTSDSEQYRPLATGWGVSSDATKFRILQLYANEEWLSGVTANRKEDGRAHVIVLFSAVDKHSQWKKVQLFRK